MTQGRVASLYQRLEHTRRPYLERGRVCSALTLPHILPPEGHTEFGRLPQPYQSLGARGVTSLASKITLGLLPPNTPNIRLTISDYVLDSLQGRAARGEVEKALNRAERAYLLKTETNAFRPVMNEAVKHALITGNALLFVTKDCRLRFFSLEQFVVQRDPEGKPLRFVVKECLARSTLSPELEALVVAAGSPAPASPLASGKEATVDLYTHVERQPDESWTVVQELAGAQVPDSDSTYPKDKCPWVHVRAVYAPGEDYGRSYVEQFIGDLKSLDVLTGALVRGSVAAARLLYLVAPNATLAPEDLVEAEDGDALIGRPEDVTTLALNKSADMAVAEQRIARLTESLSFAFLLMSAIQRDAERVTASELRLMAQDLDASLGGLYSALAVDVQLPIAAAVMHYMTKRGELPALPSGAVVPSVTTGIDAIGRGNDLQKLRDVALAVQEVFGPEAAASVLILPEYAARVTAAVGIEADGLVKTQADLDAEQAQAQQAALMQQAAAPMINQLGQQAAQADPSAPTP